jgi:hypothetical protein
MTTRPVWLVAALCDGADLKDIVRADFGAATFGLTPVIRVLRAGDRA